MKNNLWHRFVISFLRYTAGPIIRLYFRYSYRRFKGPDVPTLVIANHNTNLDPAFVSMGFSKQMYFLTSEHALRKGFASKVLKFMFAPIPINKARIDVGAIKEMVRRIKAGANVCLFAEGDRSFNGVTSRLTRPTAKLVRTSGADLITYRIEGGYFSTPRWSKSTRRGKMAGGMVKRYTAAEIKGMTDDELLSAIEADILEDAYDRQKESPVRFRGKNLAQDIETALYLCPGCRKTGTIRSEGNRFFCGCGLEGEYAETGVLKGEALPFTTITEWDIWQVGQLADIIKEAGDGPICTDENQQLYAVNAAVGKELVGEGAMWIDRHAFHCADKTFPLDEITHFAVVDQMTLLFAVLSGITYEVASMTPRSALKYRETLRVLTEK